MQNAKCKIKNFGWVAWVVLGRMGSLFFQPTQTTQSTHFAPNALNDPNDPTLPKSIFQKLHFRQAVARLAKIPKAEAYSAYVTVLGIERNAANAA